jgi:predicted  nucleic acid-binding Zn-ribbon protein
VYGFETPEEAYTRLSRERGWFDETSFERLAATVIEELQEEVRDLEESRDVVDYENSDLLEQIGRLESDLLEADDRLQEQREEQRGQDSEQRVEELEVEIEFLKTLVADMEEELAVLDTAV